MFFCPQINDRVVTTREDVLCLLRDAVSFSADIALAPVTPLAPEALAILKAGLGAEPTQVNCDPPKHDRIRRVAGRFLNARRFLTLEPEIRRLAREAIGSAKVAPKSISLPTLCMSFRRESSSTHGYSGLRCTANQTLGQLSRINYFRGIFHRRSNGAAPRTWWPTGVTASP